MTADEQSGAGPVPNGDSDGDLSAFVDDLEERVLAEGGDVREEIAEDADESGPEDADGDAEPPD